MRNLILIGLIILGVFVEAAAAGYLTPVKAKAPKETFGSWRDRA